MPPKRSESPVRGQLTLRGMLIGLAGCVVITASSVYTALKMGALPWPIIFAAIVSLFFLKALDRGKRRAGGGARLLNEANVTHTVMSAGAMVAGGLAFTIPGIWILGAGEVAWWQVLVVALAGVVMGLVCTAALRRHFVEEAELEFPIGQAAAQTLIAGNGGLDAEGAGEPAGCEGAVGREGAAGRESTGGREGAAGRESAVGREGALGHEGTGARLFGAMGFAGAFCLLRDAVGVIPAMVGTLPVAGIASGIYLSPMLLSVGFMVGVGAVLVWFLGAVLANFGIIWAGPALGLIDVAGAQGLVSSLGMGVMMGAGVGVIVKLLVKRPRRGASGEAAARRGASAKGASRHARLGLTAGLAACALAAVALVVCFALQLGPVAAVIVVALTWITTAMSAQSVGQTGIDPMEIFGLIVLLAVAAVSDLPQVQLFFVAGIVSVACGLAGDVMNDFKAGHVLGTSPRAQWLGQAAGALVGAFVAVAVIWVLASAYGTDAFGPGKEFVAAQASVVATMVSGIPHVPAFAIGLAVGFALQVAGAPAMMLGLGIYLPFYMSFTAFLGMLCKLAYDAVCAMRNHKIASNEEACDMEALSARSEERGLVIASGLLGGESVVGVLIALASLVL